VLIFWIHITYTDKPSAVYFDKFIHLAPGSDNPSGSFKYLHPVCMEACVILINVASPEDPSSHPTSSVV